MSIFSSIGNPIVPGVFVQQIPAQPAAVPTGQTNLIAIVGTATDGTPNQPIYFSNINSLLAAFGNGSALPHSLVREALSAMPECANFVGVRVTDGSELAATIAVLDGASSPGTVMSLVAIRPGSNANSASATVSLRSGSPTASPVYNVNIAYPNMSSESFGGIVAYQTLGGPYVASVFLANLLAAINGTAAGSSASRNFVATAGTSVIAPETGVAFAGAGGTDGASGVGSAQLLGLPGSSGNRTGAYALGGTGFNFLIPAANTDPAIVQNLLAFAETEGTGFIMHAFVQGSDATAAVANKTANELTHPLLIPCCFWDYVYDQFQAVSIWVSPMGKIAGIIASLDPEVDPLNKPVTGAVGVNATEASGGQGLDSGDEQLLVSNGIMYLSKGIPRNPNFFGLPHGMASDGSAIADTRMYIEVAQDIQAFLGNAVGENQSVPPLDQPDQSADTDPTRTAVRNGAKALGAQYVNGNRLQSFDATCDKTNNIRSTVLAKKLILNVEGQTNAGISFAIAFVQVGSTVSISGSS